MIKLPGSLNEIRTFNFDLLYFCDPFRYRVIQLVPHWKALKYGKDDSRGLSCGSTLNIHQEVLKNENLLHTRGFPDSQFGNTVARSYKFKQLVFSFGLQYSFVSRDHY